jgi:hypothetical protein
MILPQCPLRIAEVNTSSGRVQLSTLTNFDAKAVRAAQKLSLAANKAIERQIGLNSFSS